MSSKLHATLSRYRYPILIGALLVMSIVAHAVLVVVATRAEAPRPMANYYERSLTWDADRALLDASQARGWQVALSVPAGEGYAVSAFRPLDLRIVDRDGAPVRGLRGRVWSVRPADPNLGGPSDLVELPHAPGEYRTLAPLSAKGLWEIRLDLQHHGARFVHVARIEVDAAERP